MDVFFKNNRIASHVRLSGREGQYSTIPEHMPDNHKQYAIFINGETSMRERHGFKVQIHIELPPNGGGSTKINMVLVHAHSGSKKSD